ncbi:MAG: regulatory protein [Syntrophorhabdus sp. PtaU1.Bin050]|nr:MAG: regulatory protein [Syntrophorhabdus sp. PtaU1.Bin050]
MAFENLMTRISPTLKRITHRLNGHHAFFNDEDLFQEALIHLWVHYREGSLSDKTDSYILQGCYFHLKNYLRKVQEKATVLSLSTGTGEDGVKIEEFLSAEGATAFDYLESRMEVEAREAKYLTDREKTILSLLFEGMSMREIGAKLGISHVMVLKLRNKIKDKYVRFNEETMN